MVDADPKPNPPLPSGPAVSEGKAASAGPDNLRALLRQVEWRPVVGIAFLAGIAIVANQRLNQVIDWRLNPEPPKPKTGDWVVGKEVDVQITLITDDSRKLGCASDTVVEGTHCSSDGKRRRWPRDPSAPLDDNNVDIIQPYRTADTNQLLYVAGLWAQPELAMRLHREPPDQFAADKLLRFVAYCRVKFVGELKQAGVRWDQGAQWQEEPSALVAKPLQCTLSEPAKDPGAGAG
jgi:hypothetical protein